MRPCHDENVAMNTTTPPPPPAFTLARNPHGRLVLTFADGTAHEGVTPVRAFPIAAPTQGLALLGQDGHELLSISPLHQPPPPAPPPVSSLAPRSPWEVEPARGLPRLVLKAEEDIRRLGARTQLLIASGDGLQFCIEDSTALDRHSRRLLERFL